MLKRKHNRKYIREKSWIIGRHRPIIINFEEVWVNMRRIVSAILAITMVFLAMGSTVVFAESTTADTTGTADTNAPVETNAAGYQLYHGYDLSDVTIDFWNYITGDDNACLTKWINKFNDENPYGITIKQDSMDGDVLSEKLPVALASGTGPQLAMGGYDFAAYADQGLILPLDEIFEDTDLKRSDFIDGLLDITSYDGKLYGMPFYIGVTFMFWNKDLYRQAGLDPDHGPATWEDLYNYAKAVSALGDNYYGLDFSYGLLSL